MSKTFNLLTKMSLNSADFTSSIAGVKQNVKDLALGVDGATGNMSELAQAMRVLNNTSFAGKAPEEIDAIKKRVGELRGEMDDLRVVNQAYGASAAEVAFKTAEGFIAVGEVIVGLSSVMGVSEENMKKMQLTMTALIAVSQGMSKINELIAAGLFKKIAIQTKNIAVVVADTTATVALTVATWAYEAALATVIATIGIVVVAIAAVVAAVVLLVKAFKSNREEIKEQKKAYEDLIQVQEEQLRFIQIVNQYQQNQGTTRIVALRNELTEMYAQIKVMQTNLDLLNSTGKSQRQNKEKIEEQTKALMDLRTESMILEDKIDKFSAYDKMVDKLNQIQNIIRDTLAKGGPINEEAMAKLVAEGEKLKVKIKEVDDALGVKATPYQKLKDDLSELETNMLNVLAVGGVIKPEDIAKAEELRLKIEAIDDAIKGLDPEEAAKTTKALQDIAYGLDLEKAKSITKDKLELKLNEIEDWKKGELDKVDAIKATTDAQIAEQQRLKDEINKQATTKVSLAITEYGLEEEGVDLSEKQSDLAASLSLEQRFYSLGITTHKQYINNVDKLIQQQIKNEQDLLANKYKKGLIDKKEYNDKLARLDDKYAKEKIIRDKENQQQVQAITQADQEYRLQALGNIAGATQTFFDDQSEGYKLFAIIQASIATYLAAAQVMANPLLADPITKALSMASVIAMGLSNVAKIAGFESGGVVPGSSYTGDNIPIMANSGEMILTGGQQANLFGMIKSGGSQLFGQEVEFKIKGTELVGVLSNYIRKINKIR